MLQSLTHFLSLALGKWQSRPEKGATAVEYTMLLALILIVIVAIVASVGQQIVIVWNTILAQLTSAS